MLLRLAPGRALAILDERDPDYARAGERLAATALAAAGLELRARRLVTRWGELDLVAEERGTLVVVEVKTGRSGARYTPGMRLGSRTLARLWRAAAGLAHGGPHRVDLVEVRLDRARRVRLVRHAGLRAPLEPPRTRAPSLPVVLLPGPETLSPPAKSAPAAPPRRPPRR